MSSDRIETKDEEELNIDYRPKGAVGRRLGADVSLRDYFAAQALTSLLASTEPSSMGLDYQDFKVRTTEAAYEYADAMLKAREAKQ